MSAATYKMTEMIPSTSAHLIDRGEDVLMMMMMMMMMMMNFIHVSMYLADANWGHNIKIK